MGLHNLQARAAQRQVVDLPGTRLQMVLPAPQRNAGSPGQRLRRQRCAAETLVARQRLRALATLGVLVRAPDDNKRIGLALALAGLPSCGQACSAAAMACAAS